MKIKALKSFCGTVTMGVGDVKDIEDGMASGLIGAGYAIACPDEEKKAAPPEGETTPEDTASQEAAAAEPKKAAKKAKSAGDE